jgi:hypothetical protein
MQDDLSLEQLVSFPTRGEKTLDLVFTTHPSLVDKCKPLPSVGKSDHDIVLVDLCMSPSKMSSMYLSCTFRNSRCVAVFMCL